MKGKIHIGEIISQKLEEEKRPVVWLAEKVHCDDSNLGKILQKDNMNTDLLLDISEALDTNFTRYIADNFDERRKQRKKSE